MVGEAQAAAPRETERDSTGELLQLNEIDGPVFKIRNDPRITPGGRVLGRWSTDELPRFWNVPRRTGS